ncbi:hypothetical protein IMSAGC020_02368 [Lachnospiraceae bacterium]|nr:hypothetical protein IMSAGC020_02368 [Lachnospiraceae bacterium]
MKKRKEQESEVCKMLDANARRTIGLMSDKEDEEILKEIMEILRKHELTVDRASRVLKDARKLLPYVTKLALI